MAARLEYRALQATAAIGGLLRRDAGKGAPMSVVGADEPEDEIGVSGFREARNMWGQSNRKGLVPPVVRKARGRPCLTRERAAGFGENLTRIVQIRPQRIAVVKPSLEAWVGLAGIVQVTSKFQVCHSRL